MPKAWEVRDTIRDDFFPKTSEFYLKLPEEIFDIEPLYDRINTMVLLLDGIPYGRLYGYMSAWIDEVVRNIEDWPMNENRPIGLNGRRNKSTVWKKAKKPGVIEFGNWLLAEFQEIQRLVRGAGQEIEFASFWTERFAPEHPAYPIAQRFLQMKRHPDFGYRLCLPFNAVQDGSMSPVDSEIMRIHRDNTHDIRLKQFYITSCEDNPHLRTVLIFGLQHHIFEPPDQDLPPLRKGLEPGEAKRIATESHSVVPVAAGRGGGGANYRTCGATGCQAIQTSSWCSVDSTGKCTSGSG